MADTAHVCHDEMPREGGCSISTRPIGHGAIRCRKKAGHADACRGRDCQNRIVRFTLLEGLLDAQDPRCR